MPEVDHETERMLSGTPVHVHQLRDDTFITSAVKQMELYTRFCYL